MTSNVEIKAFRKTTGEEEPVYDLYFFEEQHIKQLNDDIYDIQIFVDGVMVYPVNKYREQE